MAAHLNEATWFWWFTSGRKSTAFWIPWQKARYKSQILLLLLLQKYAYNSSNIGIQIGTLLDKWPLNHFSQGCQWDSQVATLTKRDEWRCTQMANGLPSVGVNSPRAMCPPGAPHQLPISCVVSWDSAMLQGPWPTRSCSFTTRNRETLVSFLNLCPVMVRKQTCPSVNCRRCLISVIQDSMWR